MNLMLLKNTPFLKKLGMSSAKSGKHPHQEIVAQRDWIIILVGSVILGVVITVHSFFVFLDANTEKAPGVFGDLQTNKQTEIFDQRDLDDIRKFFEGREGDLTRLRATPPSTNNPAVVEFTSATSSGGAASSD